MDSYLEAIDQHFEVRLNGRIFIWGKSTCLERWKLGLQSCQLWVSKMIHFL